MVPGLAAGFRALQQGLDDSSRQVPSVRRHPRVAIGNGCRIDGSVPPPQAGLSFLLAIKLGRSDPATLLPEGRRKAAKGPDVSGGTCDASRPAVRPPREDRPPRPGRQRIARAEAVSLNLGGLHHEGPLPGRRWGKGNLLAQEVILDAERCTRSQWPGGVSVPT